MEDSLKKRYSIKLLSNVINGLINVILVAIVPKALGPVAYGQFNYLQQFFTQLLSFLDAGSSIAFFTKLSAKTDRRELIVFYGVFTFFLLILLLIVGFGIHFFDFSHQFLPDIPVEYIYFGLWFGFLTWVTQVYIKISDAFALSVSVELIRSVHKIISMLLLVGLVYSIVLDLSLYFYFHYVSLLSFLLLITLLFIQKGIFTKSLWTVQVNYSSLIQEFVHFCSPLMIFNIVGILAGLFDIWLLQALGGSVQSGFYGLAYSIAAMCFLFTSAMTPIITREFAKSYGEHDFEKIKKLFSRYVPMLYSVSAYFSIFIAFYSEELIQIFTDETFKNAYIVLVVMAFYPIHQTYGQLSGSLFFAIDKTYIYKNIGLVTSFIGFLLTGVFLYFFKLEALGLAWKMVIIQIISVNIQLYYNCKFLNASFVNFVWHQIYSLAFFIGCAFLSHNFFAVANASLFEFLMAGCVYTVFVIIGIVIFPQIFVLTHQEIKQWIKPSC